MDQRELLGKAVTFDRRGIEQAGRVIGVGQLGRRAMAFIDSGGEVHGVSASRVRVQR